MWLTIKVLFYDLVKRLIVHYPSSISFVQQFYEGASSLSYRKLKP